MSAKSAKAAGNRFEIEVLKFLESLGFFVERAHPKMCMIPGGRIISKAHDFFGKLDLWAIHPKSSRDLVVQCTIDDKHLLAKRKSMDEFPWGPHHMPIVWSKDRVTRGRWIAWRRVRQGEWSELCFRPEAGVWTEALGPDPAPAQ